MPGEPHLLAPPPSGEGESYLFVLRVWAGAQEGERQWCGKVQDVLSIRGGYFTGWPGLLDLLWVLLGDPPGTGGQEEA